jgi:transcriptional regulator with XRE-family HTH domain
MATIGGDPMTIEETISPNRAHDNDGLLLSSRLREARKALGLTQEDVAGVMRLHRSAVSDIESGNRKVYGPELVRLARLYRRPIAWFLGDQADSLISEEAKAVMGGLSEGDQAAVLAFARFLAHQEVAR